MVSDNIANLAGLPKPPEFCHLSGASGSQEYWASILQGIHISAGPIPIFYGSKFQLLIIYFLIENTKSAAQRVSSVPRIFSRLKRPLVLIGEERPTHKRTPRL